MVESDYLDFSAPDLDDLDEEGADIYIENSIAEAEGFVDSSEQILSTTAAIADHVNGQTILTAEALNLNFKIRDRALDRIGLRSRFVTLESCQKNVELFTTEADGFFAKIWEKLTNAVNSFIAWLMKKLGVKSNSNQGKLIGPDGRSIIQTEDLEKTAQKLLDAVEVIDVSVIKNELAELDEPKAKRPEAVYLKYIVYKTGPTLETNFAEFYTLEDGVLQVDKLSEICRRNGSDFIAKLKKIEANLNKKMDVIRAAKTTATMKKAIAMPVAQGVNGVVLNSKIVNNDGFIKLEPSRVVTKVVFGYDPVHDATSVNDVFEYHNKDLREYLETFAKTVDLSKMSTEVKTLIEQVGTSKRGNDKELNELASIAMRSFTDLIRNLADLIQPANVSMKKAESLARFFLGSAARAEKLLVELQKKAKKDLENRRITELRKPPA